MQSSEDTLLLDNPKYRQYINSVEKALKSFESSSEWADLISALGKLNKVLNPKFKIIPKKITIGKRLAQCMHPALPGGVHLKALEVYDSIFNIIKTDRLRCDLYIYAMGIFPLLVNASMQVRPRLLNIYEKHFLPLGKSLRSCIDGMLIGLLPGLEEGTEHFERTDILLERVCEKISPPDFYGAVWRCILSSSSVRLAAVQLVLRRFNRKKSTEDQLFILGSDIEVMVHALCESLQDSSVLTQRASLDVLILCCPLSNIPVSRADCRQLLLSAVHCVLRRDMSLNRRLYSWLLGYDLAKRQLSGSSSDHSQGETYFEKNSRGQLIEAVRDMLISQKNKMVGNSSVKLSSISDELFPCRILVSLLDKPEIGPVIIEDVLLDVFRLLQQAYAVTEKRQNKSKSFESESNEKHGSVLIEIAKTANLLLGVFQPEFVWRFLSQQLGNCAMKEIGERKNSNIRDNTTTFSEVCGFICLLLKIVNLESYQEIQTVHLPDLLYDLINFLTKFIDQASPKQLKLGLETCKVLLDLSQPIQPSNVDGTSKAENVPNEISSMDSCKECASHNDILKCSSLFNSFFCDIVRCKLSGDKSSVNRCIAALDVAGMHKDHKTSHLRSCKRNKVPEGADEISQDIGFNVLETITAEELINIFRLTFQLLSDFACFPIYCNGKLSTIYSGCKPANVLTFPMWLKCLLWCTFYCSKSTTSIFSISSNAMSTLLDLMSLASSLSRKTSLSKDDKDSNAGTISVVVLSPMTSKHVSMLTCDTYFYQHATEILWKVLGNTALREHHLSSVELLLRLHSMCSDSKCEDVLLEDMMHYDKEVRTKSLTKFCRFWHLSRLIFSKKFSIQSNGPLRNYNRCLFALIDCLSFSTQPSHMLSHHFRLDESGQSAAMSIVSSWLHQCLGERDLVRILEPLLLVALHPRTHSSQIRPIYGIDVPPMTHETSSSASKSDAPTERSIGSSCGRNDENCSNFGSSVVVEIARGKELYKKLLSSLNVSNEQGTDQQLKRQARTIVDDVIEASVKVLSLETYPQGGNEELVDSDLSDDNDVKHRNSDDELPSFKSEAHRSDNHILVYQENFHAARVLYALRSIITLVQTHPRLFIYTAVTSQLSSYISQLSGGGLLQDLLARHLLVLSGHSFYEEVTSRTHNMMVIDILIIVCLHFIRSWHPEDTISPESLHDIRCTASSLLRSLLVHMTDLARENVSSSSTVKSSTGSSSAGLTSQQLGPFVKSVLNKYKVNEIVLASLSTTVQALHFVGSDDTDSVTSTSDRHVDVIRSSMTSLGEIDLAFWWSGNHVTRVQSFQCHLLALVRALMVFEYHLQSMENYNKKELQKESKLGPSASSAYQPDTAVATQPLFSASLIRVLRLQSACDMHSVWLELMTSSLSYLTRALPELTLPVTSQLCRNLEHASSLYKSWKDDGNSVALIQLPSDYLVMLLKSLRSVTLFTLLLLQSTSGLQQPILAAASQLTKLDKITSAATNASTSQTYNIIGLSALGNFFNVFSNNSTLKSQRSIEEQVLPSDLIEARRVSLKNLPRILSCLSVVWNNVVSNTCNNVCGKQKSTSGNVNPCVAMGDSETVSQCVLQILNPLSLQYGENLISALAIVWERRSSSKQNDLSPLRPLTEQQRQLLNVMCSVRALHCDVTMHLVKRVIIQPPELPFTVSSKKRRIPFEECLLDFSLRFLQLQTTSSLRESWPSILTLLRECVSLGPVATPPSTVSSSLSSTNTSIGGKRLLSARCYFLLLLLLAEYSKRVPTFDDKKDQRDMQEICVKCIEACNTIVDCSLEHRGWLARRAPSVLPGPTQLSSVTSHKHSLEFSSSANILDSHSDEKTHLKTVTSDPGLPASNQRLNGLSLTEAANLYYDSSVQALNVFAQVLANLLDVIYGSEEKEKTVPVLTPVIANVTPYLRSHSLKNVPSYKAAISLLSGVSGYQQTRRAWKRDAFELFLTPDFFQMPPESVSEWMNVIDHLMTHDVTTFKDLMVRIGLTRNAATGPSLNIFSNKEQELEQRAMLLKRLAFVIFSSAVNQYQRYLPEIQERLSESLKLHQVPAVQEQVFLCFRVLLLRVSPQHLTSLWPSIITELVQVMGQLEQELTNCELENSLLNSVSDSSAKSKSNPGTPTGGVGILFNSSNPPSSVNGHGKWMAMYLSACKLLDLALLLQPSQVTHFKMFRWSFVGEPGEVADDDGDYDDDDDDVTQSSDPNAATEDEKDCHGNKITFTPHCVRIKKLLASKNPGKSDLIDVAPLRPLVELKSLSSLLQLQPFFNTIVSPSTMLRQHKPCNSIGQSSVTIAEDFSSSLNSSIEKLLEKDFVVPMT